MRHGSLFSGIGGFDLAAEWMGWENVFHCEIDKFCQKVLKYHFPNSIGYADIKTTDFREWRGKIDIVTGGFPCQPYSQAGRRKGKADDRHLWPQMLRAIREIQPTWVVGENVPGLLNWQRGMVLAEIKVNLEAAGFEVFPPVILPACGKNAPHRRDRVWIVAHAECTGRIINEDEIVANKWYETLIDIGANGNNGNATNPANDGCEIGGEFSIREKVRFTQPSSDRSRGTQWFAEPGICGVVDGLPGRLDRIKSLGNAIVPQIAFEIFKAIEFINQDGLSKGGNLKKE